MTNPFSRAPHQGGRETVQTAAPNAALLIDFDNVTMGMRSDLSKEMKSLLGSDVIRGKVTVQRAYADWRRYPQYIVPLSESSIDLIFAPAYGSNKKNATDIRMAIDGMELVFTRPEIGTYILLTGDSDFSSLVLKLKEYGKYVIGVGIQESSSDILVQNCDEYYSYTNLSGLRKTTESDTSPVDPWVLVEQAVKRMADRGDVMRSDRLKQVMLEIDGGFDEGSFGFSKFSRFVTEASSKGLLHLKKMDNGQYEVAPVSGGGGRSEPAPREREERRDRGGRNGGRGRGRDRGGRQAREDTPRQEAPAPRQEAPATQPRRETPAAKDGDPLQHAYGLLRRAVERLLEGRDAEAVRDSDVKRRMLEMESDFDEAELGFTKFSRFLRQAHDHDVIILRKRETGNYEVALPDGAGAGTSASGRDPSRGTARGGGAASAPGSAAGGASRDEGAPPVLEGQGIPSDEVDVPRGAPAGRETASTRERGEARPGSKPAEAEAEEPETLLGALGRRLGLRLGSTRRRDGEDEQPSLLEGQAVEPPVTTPAAKAAETKPAETSRSETKPSETSRAETKPSETRRPAGRPAETRRTETKPSETRRAERKPSETRRPAAKPAETSAPAARSDQATMDASALGLPTDADAQVRYLANSYKGVGTKTAESLVEGFGEDLFTVLQHDPQRVKDVIPAGRAEAVLDQWKVDFERRRSRMEDDEAGSGDSPGSAPREEKRQADAPDRSAARGGSPTSKDEAATRGASSGASAPAEKTSAPAAKAEAPAAKAAPSDAGEGGAEASPEKGARPGTITVGGVEIPEDAEPSRLRGRRSGRRGR